MGSPPLTNMIGTRGEKIFELLITDYSHFSRPLFQPCFLGDKWPTVDYYVELLGVNGTTPYFFVQVKSTTQPFLANATTLPIQIDKKKCLNLYQLPGPTYIVGIHEPTRQGFITSVHHKPNSGVFSIPMQHELIANLQVLHTEVKNFWQSHPQKPNTSHFI